MDPHHHHHQWRHRPPISAALCPICSVPHFPFCPPPFNQNTSFPQRSNFDPYLPPPPAAAAWPRNPNFVPNFPPPPPPPPYEYGGNGYVSKGGDRSFKRLRIEDFGPGSGFANPNLKEDERRLKLIHDHGGVNSGLGSDRAAKIEPVRHESSKLGGGVVNMHNNNNNNNGVIQGKTSNKVLQGYGMPQPMPPLHSAQFGASNGGYFHSRPIRGQPPLPASPPPPLPVDPPPPLLFPLHGGSSSRTVTSAGHSMMQQPYLHSKPFSHASTGYVMEFPKESHGFHQILSKPYVGEGQPFLRKHPSLDKPKVVDANHIFKKPHRGTRPDHFVIILRGLPGSGKSYLAKLLRDLEVENGGAAPRIHSMDDYFMTEVEKVEEGDASKSSSSRGKNPVMKKVMEYCYEPEMEEAYRSSMLKAFKKTVEDGDFTFVIVDDRNLRVAEFAQFWAIAKSSGYEVYILEAPYKDPAGCAARNVHGCTQDDIQKMAGQWEESPSIYLQMDAKSLFHGDDLKDSGIQEVDMDTEDADNDGTPGLRESKSDKIIEPPAAEDGEPDGSSKDMKSLDAEEDYPREVKELGRSKWSEIVDEDDTDKAKVVKGNALSGLIQAYNKEAKSLCWSDQVGNTGFSITAAKKANVSSLVIGPGAGYNLRSNPLPEEENTVVNRSNAKSKKQSAFQDQLRAEHQSFKAVFDRRRHRIGGLGLEDE